MSESKSDLLQRLFAELTETPAWLRPEAMARLRQEDEGLAGELEQLLARDEFDQTALQTPPERLAEQLGTQPDAAVIGPYHVVRRLGSGGFASVYEARRERPVRQRVALKVLRQDLVGTEAALRFRVEQQALARLGHPGIARVLAVGLTPSAQPFTAMEFVDGPSIDRYCQSRSLSWADRVDLCLRVAEAVASLHQAGVVHRDIKPGNVLVSDVNGRAFPKVIDLGIAKLNQPERDSLALATREGTLLGTPEYMSPEQMDPAIGVVGTRSDVFALGLLFWEVLMLRRSDGPVRPLGERLALSAELSSAPRRVTAPSRWRDLEPVIAKATASNPEDRYDSAGELAREIQNVIARRPIVARPPSAWSMLLNLCARHRAATTAIATLVMMVFLFAVWQTREAGAQRSLRLRAESAESAAGAKVEELARQVRLTSAINTFLTEDLLSSPDPSKQSREIKVSEVLDRAAATASQRLERDEATLAGVLHAIGQSYYALGLWKESLAQLSKAETLAATIAARSNLPSDRDSLDSVRSSKAEALFAIGSLAEAEALWVSIRQYRLQTRGTQDAGTLRAARRLAELWSVRGEHVKAEALSREIYETLKPVVAPDSKELVKAQNDLGVAQLAAGKSRDALASFGPVLEWHRRTIGDDHPNTLTILNNAARAASDSGDIEQARALDSELVERRGRVLGPDHPNTRMAMLLLGNDLLLLGRASDAERLIEPAVDSLLRTQGSDSWIGLVAQGRRAMLWIALGRPQQALALMDDVVEKGKVVYADAPIQQAASLYVKGLARLAIGRLDAAEIDLHDALMLSGEPDASLPRTQRIYAALGLLRIKQGRPHEAEKEFAKAGVWRPIVAKLITPD